MAVAREPAPGEVDEATPPALPLAPVAAVEAALAPDEAALWAEEAAD